MAKARIPSVRQSGQPPSGARPNTVSNAAPSPGPLPYQAQVPALFGCNEPCARRTLEFFAVNIRNAHTRRAYARAVAEFSDWCGARGLRDVWRVQPLHVAAYVEGLALAAPSVQQRLAALRMLFDALVVGQILPTNPASSVRGPRHSAKVGKTSVLTADEARQLLDAIDTSTHMGLRDRALLGLMIYTFARVGAATAMRLGDVFVKGKTTWVRLHEKGGKAHDMPCHPELATWLRAYLKALPPAPHQGLLVPVGLRPIGRAH